MKRARRTSGRWTRRAGCWKGVCTLVELLLWIMRTRCDEESSPHHPTDYGAQAKSAALLDIVLRERRLARLRSMQAIELSEDEARYLVLDRLLHPELNFAPQTSDKDADDDARALELLEEAHSSAGMDSTVGLNQGDEYVAQRKMYDLGVPRR